MRAAGDCPPTTAEEEFCTALGCLPGHEQLTLAGGACAVSDSSADAATLLDLQELLLLRPEQLGGVPNLLTGHDSDGSGCSGSSRLSLGSGPAAAAAPAAPPHPPLHSPGSPGWCMLGESHQQQQQHSGSWLDGSSAMMPAPADGMHHQPGPAADGAELCEWLEPGWDSGSAGDASDSDLMQWFVNAVANSSGSSSPERAQQERAPAIGNASGPGAAACPLEQSRVAALRLCSALSCSSEAVAAAPAPVGSCSAAAGAHAGAKKRGRGRPRRYDTTLPLLPGRVCLFWLSTQVYCAESGAGDGRSPVWSMLSPFAALDGRDRVVATACGCCAVRSFVLPHMPLC